MSPRQIGGSHTTPRNDHWRPAQVLVSSEDSRLWTQLRRDPCTSQALAGWTGHQHPRGTSATDTEPRNCDESRGLVVAARPNPERSPPRSIPSNRCSGRCRYSLGNAAFRGPRVTVNRKFKATIPLCQTSCRLSSFSSGLSAEAINNETTSVFP